MNPSRSGHFFPCHFVFIPQVSISGMSTPSPPVHDDKPPPSTKQTLFHLAMGHAKAAVVLDQDKQYDAAAAKYVRAPEVLIDFMQVTRNPKVAQLCAEKVQEYVHRAKVLAATFPPAPALVVAGNMVAMVRRVHEPPRSCVDCRFYDQYRDDCHSVVFHLMKERRIENLPCPSKETGPGLRCRGGKCYRCTPGVS